MTSKVRHETPEVHKSPDPNMLLFTNTNLKFIDELTEPFLSQVIRNEPIMTCVIIILYNTIIQFEAFNQSNKIDSVTSEPQSEVRDLTIQTFITKNLKMKNLRSMFGILIAKKKKESHSNPDLAIVSSSYPKEAFFRKTSFHFV